MLMLKQGGREDTPLKKEKGAQFTSPLLHTVVTSAMGRGTMHETCDHVSCHHVNLV